MAEASRRCPVLLVTAVYYDAKKSILAPEHDTKCSIAFVNSPIHHCPGWTRGHLEGVLF